jgi:hypothetical protein
MVYGEIRGRMGRHSVTRTPIAVNRSVALLYSARQTLPGRPITTLSSTTTLPISGCLIFGLMKIAP